VIADASDGILNWPETREEMKSIYQGADGASDAVKDAARETLIALTDHDEAMFVDAGSRLGVQCANEGVAMSKGAV
jgi:hypothetical protein